MGEQLTPADAALLSRVLGHEIEPGLVRTLGPSTLAAIIQAARAEGPHPESGEQWSWDMPTGRRVGSARGAVEVAFTNSLGLQAVAVCVPKAKGGIERHTGNHIVAEEGWAIDGEETWIEHRGWRAYAWRCVDVPPLEPAPASPPPLEGEALPVAWGFEYLCDNGEHDEPSWEPGASPLDPRRHKRPAFQYRNVQPLYARPSPGDKA